MGYIHWDIKLDNILLKEKNDVSSIKIVDFGLTEVNLDYDLTLNVKDKIGTLSFMAPE